MSLSLIQVTGLAWSTCGAGQLESILLFSAYPAICPWMLISFNPPFGPPRVASRVIPFPSCHTNGRQLPPLVGRPNALKPQKSSPFGSTVVVWTTPTACPETVPPNRSEEHTSE